MSIELSTITLLEAVIAFLNAVMLFAYWRVSPCFLGVRCWIAGLLTWAGCSVTFSMRFAYPDSPLNLIATNSLMMSSLIASLLGMCQFCGHPFRAKTVLSFALLAVLGLLYFIFIHPHFIIRCLFSTAFSIYVMYYIAWILKRRTPAGHELSHYTAASVYAFLGSLNLISFLRAWFLPWTGVSDLSDPIFAGSLLANGLFITPLCTFAFALLMGQRQVISGRSTERELHEVRVRLAEQEVVRQKQTLLRDLHDGLSGTITAIALNCRQLMSKEVPGRDEEVLQAIRQLAAMSNHEIRSMMHRVGSETLLWKELQRELQDFALALLKPASVQLHWETEPQPSEPIRDIGAASTFTRMIKEAVHNVLRHSQASSATVRWSFAPDQVQVQVMDNGVGLEPGKPQGRGLLHMSTRANELGGTAHYVTGSGLSVIFTLPLPLTLADDTHSPH